MASAILKCSSQIVMEVEYDSAGFNPPSVPNQLMMVKLEVEGYKYIKVLNTSAKLVLYNLDHSLFKTISFNQQGYDVLYISEHLFNLDDKIEYMVTGNSTPPNYIYQTYIYNEDGTLLFQGDSLRPAIKQNIPQAQVPIYNTPNGTKMILTIAQGPTAGNARVYGLAGTLATGINTYTNNEQDGLMAYPNPARSSTKIDYTLPNGVNKGEIVFYDTQGKEVKRFNVDNTFNTLMISTEDLQSGIYYYNLQTALGNTGAKKLVTVK